MRLAIIHGRVNVRAAEGSPQPYERFSITINPDGGRTLRTLTVSPQGSLVRDVNQNVTADWKPTSGASRLFLDGQPHGTVAKFVTGDTIRSVVHQGAECNSTEFPAPPHFSLGFHPIADEAWKMALIPSVAGKRHPLVTHTCSVTWNGKTIGHGQTVESEVEYLGTEAIVAGGALRECRAYLWFTPFAKVLKVWVLGEHNIFAGLEVLEGGNAGTTYKLMSLEQESL